MNIAYTYRNLSIALLLIGAALLISPVAHAQVNEEELAVLQVQVDEATGLVHNLAGQEGKVLGVYTTDWAKQLESLREKIMSTGVRQVPEFGFDKYNQNNKKESLKRQIAAYDKQIEHFTKLRDEAQKKLDALEDKDTASSSKKTFTIKDVKSVTKKYVDPNEQMADEEYTLYTITLKNGKEVKVKECGFCAPNGRDEAFKKAGYRGDVEALRKMAEGENDEDEDSANLPRFNKVRVNDETNKVTVNVTVHRQAVQNTPSVHGPVALGTIDWGDGEEDTIHALAGARSVKVSHTYTDAGTYTLKLEDENGTATKEIVVE